MAWPDYEGFIAQCWPSGIDGRSSFFSLGAASNVVVGTNPPYGTADFFAFYPKFAGAPKPVNGAMLTSGSAVITGLSTQTQGLAAGQLVSGTGIPVGTTILSTTPNSITISQNATASGAQTISASTPLLPTAVLNAYIALASASIMQVRWFDMWPFAMALYIAHFATLWLRSDGNICSVPGAAAAAGLTQGITVSASAGPVSEGIQLPSGLENWAAFQLTEYGIQFATFAKSIGAGPVLCW